MNFWNHWPLVILEAISVRTLMWPNIVKSNFLRFKRYWMWPKGIPCFTIVKISLIFGRVITKTKGSLVRPDTEEAMAEHSSRMRSINGSIPVTAKNTFCISLTALVAAVGKLFSLICLSGGRAVFTKGGCLVVPTVNPKWTALHVHILRRPYMYHCNWPRVVVKPVRLDTGTIKRNFYLCCTGKIGRIFLNTVKTHEKIV